MTTSAWLLQISGFIEQVWSDTTTEVIRKYAINTVTIAHLGTNSKNIQVNIQSLRGCIKAHGSQKCIHCNSVKLDMRSSEWDDTCCVTYA